MLKIAVCDDNREMLSYISQIITEYFTENKTAFRVFCYSNGKLLLSDGIRSKKWCRRRAHQDRKGGWIHIAHGVKNTAAGLRYVLYAFLEMMADRVA